MTRRVVSLLPSATENVCKLISLAGPASRAQFVGRSHECDYPDTLEVQRLPVLTAPRTQFNGSRSTHDQVQKVLGEQASSLYYLDADKLVELQPDLILTQSSCRVCSIDLASVTKAADSVQHDGNTVHTTPILALDPKSLNDVLFDQFIQIGRALELDKEAEKLVGDHRQELDRLKALADSVERKRKKRVLVVDWLDPLFVGSSRWVQEMLLLAGADIVTRDQVGKDTIDIVVIALCGLSLEETQDEIQSGRIGNWWNEILDKQSNRPDVYLVDGTAMFTRPTSRLLIALEWLVHIINNIPGACIEEGSTFPYVSIPMDTIRAQDKKKSMEEEIVEIERLHEAACSNQEAMYTDPKTGYSVLTAHFLRERQTCCGNRCRHCPYGHVNVKDASKRANSLQTNVIIHPGKGRQKHSGRIGGEKLWPADVTDRSANDDLLVVFWSGGKDSFLALRAMYDQYAEKARGMPQVVLLSTVNPTDSVVPVQNIPLETLVDQATAMELPLYIVPVGMDTTYAPKVRQALAELPEKLAKNNRKKITSLVFGDLHLADIRTWREDTFSADYNLLFPLWKKEYKTELLPSFERLCAQVDAKVSLSAIDNDLMRVEGWKVGDVYDWKLVQEMNNEVETQVDIMGECGEFHTCILLPGMKDYSI